MPRAAFAACGGVEVGSAERHLGHGVPPLAIGDSTMLLSLPALTAAGWDVNAHGCRQYPEALALLSALAQSHSLPHLVVIALGANGSITPADLNTALQILGPTRVLGLMTPIQLGGGSGSNAALVRAYGRKDPQRIDVLDWVDYSAGWYAWFAPDGLHLTLPGAAAFARLIETAGPFAHEPRKSVTLTSSPPLSAQVGFAARPTWSVRSRASGGVVVRTPGSCGYRLTASLTLVTTNAGGATGPSGSTGLTGTSGASGDAALAYVDMLIPTGAQQGPASVTPADATTAAAWATWHHGGTDSLNGAWAVPTSNSNMLLVINARGGYATGCPRDTLHRAENAVARLLGSSQLLNATDTKGMST
jgi:hypothetical protein